MELELTAESKKPRPNSKLRKAREMRGWTQAILAEKVNAGVSTVRSWEDGRKPGVVYRARLSELFGLSQEELGWESDEQTSGKAAFLNAGPLTLQNQNAAELSFEKNSTDGIGRKSNGHPIVSKNRQRMIQRVTSRWVADVREKVSPLILLNLRLVPEQVSSPWKTKNQECFLSESQEFSSAEIEHLFDHADGELLLLGETGTGKTILLRQLTQVLLARCQQQANLPIPAIFPLSSWSEKRPKLENWLVEQLTVNYQVPHRQAQEWIDNDEILPLLDGLDEVASPDRSACIDAINTYRQEHGFNHLVVSCRTGDYEALPNRLILNQALRIQPLTLAQIDTYIEQTGKDLTAMQRVLRDDPELQDLLSTPLLLSICACSAQGMSQERILELRSSLQVMLTHYVERLLCKALQHPYTVSDTRKWLSWIAWNMERHHLTEFYIERLQPSWIESARTRDRYQRTVTRIVTGLQCLVSGGLAAWLKGGLKNGVVGSGNGVFGLFGGGSGNSMLGWMAPGIGGGSQGGMSLVIVLGIVVLLITVLAGSPSLPTLSLRAIWHGLINGSRAGLKLGIVTSLLTTPLFAWRGGMVYGITYGLSTGFLIGMLMGLMRGFATGLRYDQPPSSLHTGTVVDRLVNGLIWGACGSLSFVGVEELLRVNQLSTLIYGCVVALFFFCAYGMGGGESLFTTLAEPITPVEMVTWSWGQMVQDFGQNVRKCAVIALVISINVSVAIASITSFFSLSPGYGVHYGVVLGIICGLIVGIAGLLTTMLKSGWTGKMLPEELHTHLNEGILRSVRNALLGACLFAPVGGLASGVACGIGFGLIGQLSTWPVMASGFGVMLSLMTFLIFFTAHGGIPWIQHYTLRFYLQTGCIPKHFLRFLNSASEYALLRRVGGGYTFSHRLILEYFAHLYQSRDDLP